MMDDKVSGEFKRFVGSITRFASETQRVVVRWAEEGYSNDPTGEGGRILYSVIASFPDSSPRIDDKRYNNSFYRDKGGDPPFSSVFLEEWRYVQRIAERKGNRTSPREDDATDLIIFADSGSSLSLFECLVEREKPLVVRVASLKPAYLGTRQLNLF